MRTLRLPPTNTWQLSWRTVLPLLLSLLAVWLSSQLVVRNISVDWTRVLAPALLLYSALYCAVACLRALRSSSLTIAEVMWESVGWATLGLIVATVIGQERVLPIWLLVICAPLLGDQRPRWRKLIDATAVQLIGLFFGLLLLLPLIWMIVAALRGPGLPSQTELEWLPQAPSLANFGRLLTIGLPWGRYLRNSLMVVGLGIPLSLLVGSAAGFALVQLPPRWRRPVLALSLVGLAVPSMALWLTRFLVFRWLGLLNTPFVLLAPALLGGSPLCVLLLYRAFRRVPTDQWDQARLDGAGPIKIWWLIALPQVTGVLIALSALVFGLFWGNFLEPLLYLSDTTWQTLPVGLQALQQLTRADWPVVMAASVLFTLPPIIVFILAQRELSENVSLRMGT